MAQLGTENDPQGSLKGPLVTSCVISYNHERFLREAIDSALAQTYENHEIIIVEDGSKDSSLTIAREYESRFPGKVRVLTHPGHNNRGISATCNLGLSAARGEYISWLGSDDVWLPHKIETQLEILRSDPRVGVVYSPAVIMDESGRRSNNRVGKAFRQGSSHLIQILGSNLIPAPTVLCRKACFDELGGYDETIVYSDWEMWVRILAHWELGYVSEPTTLYRVHANNVSVTADPQVDLNRKLDALRRIEAEVDTVGGGLLSPAVREVLNTKAAEFEKDVAVSHLNNYFAECRRGDPGEAFDHLKLAWKVSPQRVLDFRRLPAIVRYGLTGVCQFRWLRKSKDYSKMLRRLVGRMPGTRAAYKWAQEYRLRHEFDGRTPEDVFKTIYEKNIWADAESASGSGSNLVQTRLIISELPTLFRELGVKKLLDVPCGDFNWMRHVDLSQVEYIGGDIVPSLIAANQAKYSTSRLTFIECDLLKDELPDADMLFCRDCFVHLSFSNISAAIENILRSDITYLCTTSFVDLDENNDIVTGLWRPRNLQHAPFNFPEPLKVLNEGCSEGSGSSADKSLCVWAVNDLRARHEATRGGLE